MPLSQTRTGIFDRTSFESPRFLFSKDINNYKLKTGAGFGNNVKFNSLYKKTDLVLRSVLGSCQFESNQTLLAFLSIHRAFLQEVPRLG